MYLIRRYIYFAVILIWASLCGFVDAKTDTAAKNMAELKLFVVPMAVDGKRVNSEIYVALPFNGINKKYAIIKQTGLSELSNPEKLLTQLITSVENKDVSKVVSLVDPSDQVLLKLGKDAYVDRFNASLKVFSPDEMVVEGVIHRKEGERIVVSSRSGGAAQMKYRIFSFKKIGNEYLYTDSMSEKFDNLINHVFKTYPVTIRQSQKGDYMWYPENYVTGQLAPEGSDGDAFLVFKGKYISKEREGKKKAQEDSVDKILNNAKTYLKKRDLNGYADLFYGQSKNKALEAIGKVDSENLKFVFIFNESATRFFKLSVNKYLSINFVKTSFVNDDYLYVLAEGKKIFFTNYGDFSSLDSVLRSESFLRYISDKR